ncbi:MAG: RidA family protein [Gemmatimonadales bacterium]
MTRRILISSGSPFETTVGFSRAVRVGNAIHVAGTAPIGADGKTVALGDPSGQARRCFEVIRGALEEAGGSLADVVRTRVFLTRIDDWPEVARVHGDLFGEIRPVCTVVQVVRLIDPDWLVEIEVDAINLPLEHP